MNEIKAFIIETPESLLSLFHYLRFYEPESESSSDTKSVNALTLDFSVCRTVRNKFVICQSPAYGILL